MFKKYQHVEKFGNKETMGIELGECYVFPKLDGTNSSLWFQDKENFGIHAGSRNRELSYENDNANFYNTIVQNPEIHNFFAKYPHIRLYGEWLVPHTLKTYRDDAWRRFYIFDIYNDINDTLLPYDVYQPMLEEFSLDYIPPLAIIKNGSYENFIHVLNQNNLFIKDGAGIGEGIVIKNYSYYNQWGNQIWAKIVASEFKEQHYKVMGPPETVGKLIEEQIVEHFCTEALITKTQAKIQNENDGWSSKNIPEFLGQVEYDLIKEESFNIIKKFNFPTINFRTLKHFIIAKIKRTMPELF